MLPLGLKAKPALMAIGHPAPTLSRGRGRGIPSPRFGERGGGEERLAIRMTVGSSKVKRNFYTCRGNRYIQYRRACGRSRRNLPTRKLFNTLEIQYEFF